MHHFTYKISHTTAFVTPVVEQWLEGEMAQWVDHEGSIQHHKRTLSQSFIRIMYAHTRHIVMCIFLNEFFNHLILYLHQGENK